MAEYDSREDTLTHINEVALRLANVMRHLHARARDHDKSKLSPKEKPSYDVIAARLKGLTYGSEEYKDSLRELKPALDHHYANNSHHPEHYFNGVDGMDLLDLIEMYCDWAAAVTRHADGDLKKSIAHNEVRFKMTPQLASIFKNTFDRYGGFCGDELDVNTGKRRPAANKPLTLSGRIP